MKITDVTRLQSSVLQTEATLKLTLRHHCPLVMELVVLMAHLGARCGIRLSIIVRKALLAACQMVQLVANVYRAANDLSVFTITRKFHK